jgi:hypothetical protein
MITSGNTKLEIIQGDTFYLSIRLKNTNLDNVEKIYFSCSKLDVLKEFVKNDDVFELEIDSAETSNFNEGAFSYDITVVFVGNKVITAQYKGTINVLEKYNKVTL